MICFQIAATVKARIVLKTIKESIKTADEALTLYDKLMDRLIPWKEFNEILAELNKFRKDYSVESALLISEIKTFMMDGMDAYFSASQDVYEWASVVIPKLNLYIKLFNNYDKRRAEAQKRILIEILGGGIAKMTDAQTQLRTSFESFNSAFGKLSILRGRFETEFDEKSEFVDSKLSLIRTFTGIGKTAGPFFGIFGIPISFASGKIEEEFVPLFLKKMESIKKFYDKLQEKVQQSFDNIHKTKTTLSTEIAHIGDLKIKTQQTETFVNLDDEPEIRDVAIEYAQALIEKCEAYRKRHVHKTDLL